MESTSCVSFKNSDLCKKVQQKLGQDCLSEHSRNELSQVNGDLAEATKEYFKYKLIVDSVKKFLDQNVAEKAKNEGQGILSDPFYLTVVKKYISEDGIQPFGITENFVDKTISRKKKTQKEKDELNIFVENEINSFCNKISEYTGYAQRYRNNPQRAFQESVKDLSSELDDLTVSKYKFESEEKEINDLISDYFENLVQGISMLKRLVSLYEKKLEFQSAIGNLYKARQATLASKINEFEHQVLVATYTKRSIEALKKIKAELDDKKESLDNDINSTNCELQSYCALGPQFRDLVDEYTELLKQIDNQDWANKSLRRKQYEHTDVADFSNNDEANCSEIKETLVSSDCVKAVETLNISKVSEAYCTGVDETLSYLEGAETLDCSEANDADCTGVNEILDCSEANDTDCTGVNETLDCSEANDTDCTGVNETLDCSEANDTDCTGVNETLDCSEANDTDCTGVNETLNCSEVKETLDCSESVEVLNCLEVNQTDCTGADETSNRLKVNENLDLSKADETFDLSRVDETLECSKLDETLEC